MPENRQRMTGSHQYVQPQIELKAVEKVGIGDVTLNYITRMGQILRSILSVELQNVSQFFEVVYEENAFTLA